MELYARDMLRAAAFASARHGLQIRKYTNEPYVCHPLRVAYVLAEFGELLTTVLAGVLHDTLEDTDATRADIEREFGERVAKVVVEVTDVAQPGDGNRAARAQKNLAHLAQCSQAGATIKLVDISDNAASILKHDLAFARVWVPEKIAQLNVLRHGHHSLYRRARAALLSAPADCLLGFSERELEEL